MVRDASWSSEVKGSKESVATKHGPVWFPNGERWANVDRRDSIQLNAGTCECSGEQLGGNVIETQWMLVEVASNGQPG
ncbi:hypothetical protein A5740_00525 [Mycobacterium sp. GA-1841]|nr:hypothetical protein A5740_00525 [Mycobacterium sp. GA-1841]